MGFSLDLRNDRYVYLIIPSKCDFNLYYFIVVLGIASSLMNSKSIFW